MIDVALPPVSSRRRLRLAWLAWLAEAIVIAGLLALALWLRVPNLDAYTGSFDEGIRVQQLLLMSAGYRPFRDIFASQGPLLLDLLYPFYLWFGQTLAAARAGVVVCSIVGLIGAGWTARQIAGPAAGIAAVLILAVSPTFLDGSRLALAEVPTLAPSLLALGCLLAYRRSGNRWLLALAGCCCALAVLIKPMALHVGAPIAVMLLLPSRMSARAAQDGLTGPDALIGRDGRGADGDRTFALGYCRRWLIDVLGFGVLILAICAIVVLMLGPAQVWDNLGAYRGGAGHKLGADAVQNLRLTANIMRQEQPGLFVLAGIGALLGFWRRPVPTLALLAWAAAVLGLFALYGDLADKHIVLLLPPVALLAAVGAGLGISAMLDTLSGLWRRQGTSWAFDRVRLVAAVLGTVGIAAYAVSLPTVNATDRYLLRDAPKLVAERRGRAVDQEIAGIIRDRTPIDGWVLADNPLAAFEARRKVIPYLVDTSGTRIDAGSLTASLAIDQIQRYQPSVIVTAPRRLAKLDDLIRRLPELGYRLQKSYELGWKVYVRE